MRCRKKVWYTLEAMLHVTEKGNKNSTIESDVHMPFVEGIDLDKEIDREQVELLRSTEGRWVQHIRVKGSPTKALTAVKEVDDFTERSFEP